MEITEINENTIEYYSNLITEYGSDLKSVGQSEISQTKRFDKIIEIGDLNNKSILDVGCGLGSFFNFLMEKSIDAYYWGFDITPEMIRIAKKNHPEIEENYQVVDFLNEDITTKYDYVVSLGALNLPMSGRNISIAIEFINKMYNICNIGMAISMTSSFTKKPNNKTFYFEPNIIVEKVGKFCQNLKLDHSYLPHDFTLFCYKKGLYDF